jgi:hypothetical protein
MSGGPGVPPPSPPSQATAVLVPPRPNLGPEPFETSAPWRWAAGPAAVGLAVVAAAWWARSRRGTRRPTTTVKEPMEATRPSPDEAILALADRAREALVSRFGESFRAKTTEEVAPNPDVVSSFDAETRERLAELLRHADLVKFAGRGVGVSPEDFTEAGQWAEWVEGFVVVAGARSTTRGK